MEGAVVVWGSGEQRTSPWGAGSGGIWRVLINLACFSAQVQRERPSEHMASSQLCSKGFPKKMSACEHESRRKWAEGSDGSYRIGRDKSAPRIKSVSIRLWGGRDGKPLELRHSAAFTVDTRTDGLKAVGVKLAFSRDQCSVQSRSLHHHKTFAGLKIQFHLLKQ